jgi:predicted RNA binding protein YcfA (HicA-like mRNA interferase family)
MSGGLPAISGKELIKLLKKDGWEEKETGTHGQSLIKKIDGGRTLVTIVPTSSRSLPSGTLHDILGMKQTQLGRDGLLKLLGRK